MGTVLTYKTFATIPTFIGESLHDCIAKLNEGNYPAKYNRPILGRFIRGTKNDEVKAGAEGMNVVGNWWPFCMGEG